MSKDMSPTHDDEYSKSQIPEILEWFGDIVENYHTAIVISFSTMICLVISGMFVLRLWIRSQENAHKNCKSVNRKFVSNISDGAFGAVVENQPISRSLVFSETVPEAVLLKMPEQKAEVIRLEKEIAHAMTKEQRLAEAEVQRKQLEAVYELMAQNEEKFGEASLTQIYSQASMYGK